MKRGNIWWVNFENSIGGEVQKQRPVVIISNDAANTFLNRVQVVPLTSNIDKLYPSEAYVTFRGKKAKAMTDQITTVSKKRLLNSDGFISDMELESISQAVKIQLAL